MADEAVRIMLTGANGQLGFELTRALSVLGQVFPLSRQACDLSDAAAIDAAVSRIRPTVICNAAAWTAVDRAETESEATWLINASAPAHLARAAQMHRALLVHYSTDYVFDGTKAGLYHEEDQPTPLSVYGQSKLAGEQAVSLASARHLIFRTSWVYGAQGQNFLKTVLRLAQARKQLAMVADQFGAPTAASLLADVTAQVLGQYLNQACPADFPYGLYHVAASGVTTWADYARYVVSAAQALGWPLALTAEAISSIATDDYPLPARRPANSRLSCDRLCQTFGLVLPAWQLGVQQVLQQLAAGRH